MLSNQQPVATGRSHHFHLLVSPSVFSPGHIAAAWMFLSRVPSGAPWAPSGAGVKASTEISDSWVRLSWTILAFLHPDTPVG